MTRKKEHIRRGKILKAEREGIYEDDDSFCT
jgi:hypothetical protein